MKYFKNKYIYYLLVPFVLALLGIGYGLPMHLIGDEEALIGGTLKMLELRQPFPVLAPEAFKFLYYPPIIPYLYILASLPVIIFKFIVSGFDVLALKDYFVLNLDGIWISARLMTAIFSLGVLVVTYKITKLIFFKPTAYLATSLLSVSFFHVLLSHWARHWIFTIFLVYLTVLLALLFARGKIKKHWLIGLIAGIALGTTYLTLAGLGLAVLILWFYRYQIVRPIRKIVINIALAFVIGFSLIFINLPDLLRYSHGDDAVAEPFAKSLVGFWQHLGQAITVLFNQELIILFLAIIALLLWKRYLKIKLFILFSILAYLAALYLVFHFETRYVYFVIPALAILAADTLIYLSEKIKNQKVYYLIIILIFIWPVLSVINYTRLILVDDTRELAVQYINQEIEDQEFLLVSPYVNLHRSLDSLSVAQDYGRINSRERYVYSNYKKLTNNFDQEYNYQNLHFWTEDFQNQDTLEEYINKYQPSYFVLEYWDEDALAGYYQDLRQKADLVKMFRQSDLDQNYDINGNFWAFNSILFKLDRLGPSVEIYKIK
jgi:hypothetical protein